MSNLQSQISAIQSRLLPCYPADEANALAWWIAEELTGLSRTELQFGCKGTNFSSHMQEIETIIGRLLHFEPIQYIFGHTLWNGLDLKVTPSTLIPRPETAELVERINEKMVNEKMVNDQRPTTNDQRPTTVLDVGTGSGCIAISLKKAHPEWSVTGIDISPEAIEVARENARRNNVEINFQVADIFTDQMTKYFNKWYMVNDPMVNEIMVNDPMVNIVVSNPPYICESEKVSMRPNVLDYEPSTALFVPDSDPLLFYRRIAELSSMDYRPSTNDQRLIFFEINEAYGPQLSAMLSGLGYTDIQITKDIYGKDRIIEARMAR
jgi:release factor glutamine methyltransferase